MTTGGYVFLSYSRRDRDYVSRLASFLGTAGVPSWFDPEIRYGADFERVIHARIDDCAAVLVVMTPDSAASEWVGRELDRAEGRAKPIVPLLLAGAVFGRLARLNYHPCLGGSMPGQDLVEQLRAYVGLPDGDRLAELRAAMAEPRAWQRAGALMLVERLLGSVREETRDAARTARGHPRHGPVRREPRGRAHPYALAPGRLRLRGAVGRHLLPGPAGRLRAPRAGSPHAGRRAEIVRWW